jgi:hypothetical protein
MTHIWKEAFVRILAFILCDVGQIIEEPYNMNSYLTGAFWVHG